MAAAHSTAASLVHGARLDYDLPDLMALTAPGR